MFIDTLEGKRIRFFLLRFFDTLADSVFMLYYADNVIRTGGKENMAKIMATIGETAWE